MDTNKELLKLLDEKFDKLINTLSNTFFTKEDYTKLLQNLSNANPNYSSNEEDNTVSFSQKEVEKMPPGFKKIFKTKDGIARIYKRKISKNAFIYEIRFRRNGYNIISSAKTLKEAKEKFLQNLKIAKKSGAKTSGTPKTFHSFCMFFFNNFRSKKVAKNTMQGDLGRYKLHIKPYFEEKPLSKITAIECQFILDNLDKKGKGKTADEIASLLNIIFKGAIAHDVIKKNPMELVIHKTHEREHGKALTVEEEKLLLESTEGTEFQLMFAIALFTGMRPNEYETARREGDFIVCRNSKRKNGKIEYKKIPITPMLRPYIKDTQTLTFYKTYTLREKFNSILTDHILYDLRTTFYSRCIECGVTDIARKLFVGHTLGQLGDAYTDLSDEYLLKEGEKIKY